ncbi:signal recognition particle SRP9/SRP14 subunit [Trametes versicolor FP-101664 SS1]|uniref:signal recognition particle SRP9/SRP14 subunit n=1 Tax=Trametes versicolor (strain FP-101664) TaxID=717944 RepID=UPI00046242D9|nr:signal recognition particle SRP9/SRP14 subunit [Trametes versicolor FP-101664 SS1]EIW56814.1 signal recognition particle SRP9/SRP14 subunit [Trametes versicolor FP-101664 SS1]
MVYISSWQEYQEAAEALYEKSPNSTRYCVKWRQSADGGGKLVLKITDNTTCLKFKTHSSVFLNRFDALNLTLMQKMQNRRPAQASTTLTPSASIASQIPTSASSQTAASEAHSTPAPGGPAGGGVKKKKPKKKK